MAKAPMSAAESTSTEATSSAETAAVPESTTEATFSVEATAVPKSTRWRRCDRRRSGDMRYSCDRHRMRRCSWRGRAGPSSKWRLMVTTVSTNPAAAVAVVAIVVTVAARRIVDRRGVPPCPVRIVADHVRVVGIVTVGVAVILALRQVVPGAPHFMRSIPPRRAPVSDYRERDHCNDCEARAENCPTTSVLNHIEHVTVEHLT